MTASEPSSPSQKCGPGARGTRTLPSNGYLDQVWSKYSSQTLSIDTQGQWGTVTGQVSGGVLDFPGVGSFGRPSSADIFSCNSGPFNTSGAEMGALTQTNHYARIVHGTSLDGRGYAFPYDDVAPTGGADQSGAVVDSNPTLLTVTLGAVNGAGVVNNLSLPGTGSWSSWNTVTVPGVALNAGANTVSVIYNSSNGSSNHINLDEVTVQHTG